jgi:N-sulfoglucosamine sulfohydrolase
MQMSIRDARWKLIYSPRGQGENRYARAYLEQANAHFAGGTKTEDIVEAIVYETFLHPPEYELYDLEADPHEFVNLADNPKRTTELHRMIEALAAWQVKHADPLFDPGNVDFYIRESAAATDGKYRGNSNHRWQYLDRFKAWREERAK